MTPENLQKTDLDMVGEYARFDDDPNAVPADRPPRRETVTVAAVGGGFTGLLLGAELRKLGIEDFRIIDRAGDFGGTWYWNRYPGVRCDTESYVYLPLLEETGYMPTEKYATGPEIFEHCKRIADRFRLYDNALLSTEVTQLTWQPATSRWLIETHRGDRIEARFVVLGTGIWGRPQLPGIPGLETFEGNSFHTSRWDYAYTGGAGNGKLDKLADKRVGVIGTGSTAVQIVPRVAEWANELFVFQRTPACVDVRANRDTDPEWFAALPRGWQRDRIRNFTTVLAGGKADTDLVMDCWTDVKKIAAGWLERNPGMSVAEAAELADFEKMDTIRDRVERTVGDPAVAEALKPWYRRYCKRPTFNDEYLPAYNRPNVHLVDSPDGVERITPAGVVVDGEEYPLDCLVFASGFELPNFTHASRTGFETAGVGGILLSKRWAQGMQSMFGMHVNGFPNLFHVGVSPQGIATASVTHMLYEYIEHITHLVQHATAHGIAEIEPTREAEAAWIRNCRALGTPLHSGEVDPGGAYVTDCLPEFVRAAIPAADPPDTDSAVAKAVAEHGRGPLGFFAFLAEWRAAGDYEGLDLRPESALGRP